MNIKRAFNTFLQFIYKLLAGVLSVCAVILIIGVLIALGFNLIQNKFTLFFLGGVALLLLFYVRKNYDKISEDDNNNTSFQIIKELFKLSLGTLLFCFIVVSIGKIKIVDIAPVEETNELASLVVDSSQSPVTKQYKSIQTWKDFNRYTHRLPFTIDYSNVENSRHNRNAFRITNRFSWGPFYKYLADNDKPLVEVLAQTFFNYQKNKQMNRREFAELMITAVQDVPYNLILHENCKRTDVQPCYGNVHMGLHAPAEFISNLRGGCDTRTVLLFTLLSRFNYDVAILNSEEYRHSILGLNITATGKFKRYNNKKYYFIETTAIGCPIGYLDPQFSKIEFWDVVLTHQYKYNNGIILLST